MNPEENHHGKYRHGKQEHPISFKDFQEQLRGAQLDPEQEAFMWLLYYTGVRKSEAYERVASDVEITPELFTIDFHTRKKHGATVPPLGLPLGWPGVTLLCQITMKARALRPVSKMVFYYEQRKRVHRIQKEHWLFPNIQSSQAWLLCKRVLGEQFYPHFLRLSRLTELGSDPSASLVSLKSFSGIKSILSLEYYLGTSKEEQKRGLDWMQKKIDQS